MATLSAWKMATADRAACTEQVLLDLLFLVPFVGMAIGASLQWAIRL
jgi:uncharacterized membrane protein